MPRPFPLARTAAAAVVATVAAGSAGPARSEDAPPAGKAPAAPAADLVPVASFFHGKVTKVDGPNVEISYDFSDPSQLKDFEASCPFRAIRTITYEVVREHLELKGTGSLRHKAVFDGDVGAAALLKPRKPRDFGFAVSEARESEVFTLYCLYDRYFGAGDNVHVPQNMIIKFIPRDPKVNANGLQDWRYCGSRGQDPQIAAGRPYRVSIQRTGIESQMTIANAADASDDFESKGREAGRDLTSQMVALYAYDGHFEADDLVVRGRLAADFVERHRIDLTSWKPPVAAPAPPPAAPGPPTTSESDPAALRARATIDGYPLTARPQALAQVLRDPAVPAHLRTEAAEKAKSAGLKRIVPFLVDGLYSDDAEARRLSFDVVKALTGKSFNYRPDGPEDARKKAIRDLNEHLTKNAAEYS